MCDALGIIAYNDPTVYVSGLEKYRPLAAINFLGRYRLVDFPISNMVNSGIEDIDVYINGNPRPMIEHLGSGRQFNINSKHGNLNLFPLYLQEGTRNRFYVPDIASYYDTLDRIEEATGDYVVIAPANIIYVANYADLLDQHVQSGADITILFTNVSDAKDKYRGADLLDMNRQRGVLGIKQNQGTAKNAALSLQTYILKKSVFMDLVKEANAVSGMYWFKDIVNDHCGDMDIRGVKYNGKVYSINDLPSYFECNMAMLDEASLKAFGNPDWPIYTRTSDSAPTIYGKNGSAENSFISNGCTIDGEVKNSIVGRGVIIGKNAQVDSCVLMPGAVIGDNAILADCIIDKGAKITKKKELFGTSEDPIYVGRKENI
jgi:glucose-1-phosphate adenylyltransferase